MAHHVNASYDEAESLFLPPLRTLGFNPQLQLNDHLLVQSYIEAYDISYPEALRRIEEEVSELKQHIEATGFYELTDIGVLRLNNEGHYEFEPCEAGILTPDYYGLSSFAMQQLSIQPQQETIVIDGKSMAATGHEAKPALLHTHKTTAQAAKGTTEEEHTDGHAIVIRTSWLRNAVAIAAAIMAFFLIGTPISNSDSTIAVQQSSMVSGINGKTSHLKTPTPENGKALPAAKEEKTAVPAAQAADAKPAVTKEPSFTIVMASETPLRHAEEFIERLNKKGFTQARTMNMVGSSKLRVVYETFASHDEALQRLRSLRQQDKVFSEAWILEIKSPK